MQPFFTQVHLEENETLITMRNLLHYLFILGLAAALFSCTDKYTESYRANVPVYMTVEEWRALDAFVEAPTELSDAGKIYVYQDYLFVVERGQGVHIIDNSNPASPQNLAFLGVLGCVDLAVRNNTLYLDSFYDLLSFDLSDPANPILSCRLENAFNFDNWSLVKGYDNDLPFTEVDTNKGVIVGWAQKDIVAEAEPFTQIDGSGQIDETFIDFVAPANRSTGIGGSMAQFTITGDYLYVLRPASITSFSIGGGLCPQELSVTAVRWNAETIFPYNNHLFLGTTSGMLIYDLQNPAIPEHVSSIQHLTACDPVVVQGDRAYVTVRTGTQCWGIINRLLVIDISDYTAPATLAEYDLVNPHGLGIDGNTLFICDGRDGLKVFDAEDDLAITDHQIAHYQDINSFDAIPYNDVLIMSAEEGIYQYDYSDPLNISQLSFIPSN